MKNVLSERPELEEDSEFLKTLAYQKWIDQISEDYKIDINPNEIIGKNKNYSYIRFYLKDCINMMTELLSLYKDQIERPMEEKKDFEGIKIKMEEITMKIEEVKENRTDEKIENPSFT